MFKFNFDVDELDDTSHASPDPVSENIPPTPPPQRPVSVLDVSREHLIGDLLAHHPPSISFSPLNISVSPDDTVTLARRDLFDARFQLISSGYDDTSEKQSRAFNEDALDFFDAPSDLVPGVYEGGLKTWECSLDLAGCLHRSLGETPCRTLKGKRMLELGCGTAIPSLYALYQIFSAPFSQDEREETTFVLQDYNLLVLQLVTLPNAILAWYMSPASSAFRASYRQSAADPDVEEEPLPPADPKQIGTLPISSELVAAFLATLKERNITIRFFSGSWDTFNVAHGGGPFDIVLTSETIYRTESLPALVRLLHDACRETNSLEEKTAQMKISTANGDQPNEGAPYLCLVAAKLVYFGVGGGVAEFIRAVKEREGASTTGTAIPRVETLWEHTEGVKRIVMRVIWH